ncbi:DUF499 domain-containing protein [Streptomyces sp. NPDC007162]|uniref:DUF499 domain-containing protein n=1 Tax=Streptomyces sp. NPDC007162 TaxID=3156917 RepID=UPI00340A0030
MSATALTPWWETLRLREEITDASGVASDIQVSLYRVAYGEGANKPHYASASAYGQVTHPTSQLVELLTQIAIRLAGGPKHQSVPALTRLDQGMGGGKSHACIGAWHLVKDPEALAQEDIGREVFEQARAALGQPLPRDLNKPHVVVLSCDNMVPGATVPEQDGPWAHNLYERFLWRLFDGLPDQLPRYDSYRSHFSSKAKIGEAIASLDRPVLIVIDEVLNYVGDGLEGYGDKQLIAQDMAFLRALTETVSTVPHVSMLVVMINSEKDPTTLQGNGDARRQDLQTYLERNGKTKSVNENGDFTAILRRRLFANSAGPAVDQAAQQAVEAFRPIMEQGNWKTKVFGALSAPWVSRFQDAVVRSYPFHPQLMDLAEREWANLTGFQQVRSTITIFAATAYALAERAKRGEWTPLLIGPGDLPLSDGTVRDAVIGSGLISDTKTQGNYRSIAQSDIVDLEDDGGAARRLDASRVGAPWVQSNPRAAERAATFIYLASIVGTRGGSRRGASDPEAKAVTVVPDLSYDYAEADAVVRDLTNADDAGLATVDILEGRGGQPRRYFLSTRQRLPMLIRAMRNSVTDEDRDQVICKYAKEMLTAGPFAKARFIHADASQSHRALLVEAEIDEARTTRLIALDPAMYTVGNGTQKATLDAAQAVLGLGADRLAVAWASSAVFTVASARGRTQARRAATEYLASERVLEGPEAEADEDIAIQATGKRDDDLRRLKDSVRRAFQHVLYLAQPDPTVDREVAQLNLDQGTLDGAVVWEALATAQKAFRPGEFTGTALLHNLRDSDYDRRPLSEIRDSFWDTPRLGLLPGDGTEELRRAIYQAVHDGELRIVRQGGEPVVVDALTGINFNAPTYRLAKPEPAPTTTEEAEDEGEQGATGRSGHSVGSGASGSSGSASGTGSSGGTRARSGAGSDSPTAVEQQVAFTVMKNLVSEPESADKLAQLFRKLFDLLDRGAISYLSSTLQVTMPSEQASEVKELAQSLGISVSIRDR